MQRQTSRTHIAHLHAHTDTYNKYTTHIQQVYNTHNIDKHIHTHVRLCILQFRAENEIVCGFAYNEASILNTCSFMELATKDETKNFLCSCEGIEEDVARKAERDQSV